MRVPTRKSDGDLAHLGETFNKMTAELRDQRESLIEANLLNEERRAFIEAALAGVPAGDRRRRPDTTRSSSATRRPRSCSPPTTAR